MITNPAAASIAGTESFPAAAVTVSPAVWVDEDAPVCVDDSRFESWLDTGLISEAVIVNVTEDLASSKSPPLEPEPRRIPPVDCGLVVSGRDVVGLPRPAPSVMLVGWPPVVLFVETPVGWESDTTLPGEVLVVEGSVVTTVSDNDSGPERVTVFVAVVVTRPRPLLLVSPTRR